MNNEIFKLLSKMNGGKILDSQDDKTAEVDISTEDTILLKDCNDDKYYFFSEYIVNGKEDNFDLIEKATIKNEYIVNNIKISPSDAYLILFWKVDEINDSIYSRVIKLEEDEMFYKKYVIYYTQNEYDVLEKMINELTTINLEKMIEKIFNEGQSLSEGSDLAIRIMSKIPFWTLKFPEAQMVDFDDMVRESIKKNKKNDIDLMLELNDYIGEQKCSTEQLVDDIFENYLGD